MMLEKTDSFSFREVSCRHGSMNNAFIEVRFPAHSTQLLILLAVYHRAQHSLSIVEWIERTVAKRRRHEKKNGQIQGLGSVAKMQKLGCCSIVDSNFYCNMATAPADQCDVNSSLLSLNKQSRTRVHFLILNACMSCIIAFILLN